MRVVEVGEYGGPEVLREAERPDPRPAAGRVRVRIAAATVNPVDLWTRAGSIQVMTPGLTPPFLLGWDLAGTVLEDADGFTAGQRVVGMVPWFGVAKDGIGSYAEIVSADPSWLAPVPDGVVLDAAMLGQPVVGAVADGGGFVSASAPTPAAERGIRVQLVQTEPDGPRLAGFAADLAAGRLTARVQATLPLAQAVEAHRRAATRGQRGKIVLVP